MYKRQVFSLVVLFLLTKLIGYRQMSEMSMFDYISGITTVSYTHLPSFLFFSPFFIVYIGPPDISPFSLTSLYLIASIHSENFEESPKQAEIHIHTKAPAPPETIAVATPVSYTHLQFIIMSKI